MQNGDQYPLDGEKRPSQKVIADHLRPQENPDGKKEIEKLLHGTSTRTTRIWFDRAAGLNFACKKSCRGSGSSSATQPIGRLAGKALPSPDVTTRSPSLTWLPRSKNLRTSS